MIASPAIDPDTQIQSLVYSARRRWILQRAAEFISMGFVAGFVVSGIAILIAPSHGSTLFLAAAFPAIGSAIGAVIAIVTAPSISAVVARIDSMLGNDDLLSTAWTSRGSADRWRQTLLFLAAQRCGNVAPSQFVPTKIGLRGGVLLAVIVSGVLTVEIFHGVQDSAATRALAIVPDRTWSQWAIAPTDDPGRSASLIARNEVEAKAETPPETKSDGSHDSHTTRLVSEAAHRQTDETHTSDTAGPGAALDGFAPVSKNDWTMHAGSSSTNLTEVSADGTGDGDGFASPSGSHASNTLGKVELPPIQSVAWGQSNLSTKHQQDGFSSEGFEGVPSQYRAIAIEFYSMQPSR